MAEQRKFLLDSNILIEAHKRYYGFDLCPGFWTAIILQHQANRVFSIDRVKQEIAKIKDKLDKWTRFKAPKQFFKMTDNETIVKLFGKMIRWVQSESQYKPEAKAEFAEVADGWLIAYAKANGMIVVTHEEYAPDAKKKVPIPNVCRQFGVECVNTFEMLHELGIKFVLKKQ
ncbi:MAG: DUF4411 family protein [Thermoguttaceae bacterium]|jgi:hypothetical protein